MNFEQKAAEVLESRNTHFATMMGGAALMFIGGYELAKGNVPEAYGAVMTGVVTLGISSAGPEVAETIRIDSEASKQSTPEDS